LNPLCCADRLVGKGGTSWVYSGRCEDGKELAVKVLKSSEEAVKEFVAEIDIISSIDHRNAMALVGFCAEHGKLMLVYDYMSRGSLEEILHGECMLNLIKRNAGFSML
jgi:serine/threonine protein kinase